MGCLMGTGEEEQAGHVRTSQQPPNLSALERLLWQQGQVTSEGRQGRSQSNCCVPGAGRTGDSGPNTALGVTI